MVLTEIFLTDRVHGQNIGRHFIKLYASELEYHDEVHCQHGIYK